MKRTFRLAAFSLFFSISSLAVAQGLPPGTGAATEKYPNGTLIDSNWYITSDTTGVADPNLFSNGSGYPSIVTGSNLAPGWAAAIPNTTWIAPAANQNVPATGFSCCVGQTTYVLAFNVSNPSTYPGFTISLLADNFATITLNGKPVPYTLTQEYLTVTTIPVSTGFVTGTNTIDFTVANQGGSTGLDVGFTALSTAPPPTSTLGPTTSHATYHIDSFDDPTDSATGQFYETDSEIQLGGPTNLALRRYYSSQLSGGYNASALGKNWMTNFDPVAVITGSNAQVLMFGGKIISFSSSGSVWQLVAPKDIGYQFIQSGTKFVFMDPISKLMYTFTTPGVLTPSIVGALTSIADRNGNTITITQGANGPTQIADGLGRTLAFTYANGQLTKVTDQASRSVSFTYTNGLLASVTDIYNQTTTYAYSTVGTATALLQHKQQPAGNIPASQTFDAQSRVLSQRIVPGNDGKAYTATIAYDGTGGTTVTDGLGAITKQVSDATGDIVQVTNPLGGTAIVTYDASNRRTSITDKLGKKTSYAYDPLSGFLSSITDASGSTTSFTYLAQSAGGFTFYHLNGVTYPDGTTLSSTFDANGNPLVQTNRKGGTTKYTYDASGRIASITTPNQQPLNLTWNVDGTLASTIDALSNKQTFAYDNTKRVTSIVDANGGTTGYVWDKSTTGPMLAIISPVAHESTTLYDDPNRELQDVAISTGGVFHRDYTATGQLQDFIDPLKNKTAYGYDGDDRLSTITSPAGEVVTYTWDAGSRVTSISDVNGPRASYTYTAENRVATETDGSGRKASYTYDALGRLITLVTAGGNSYSATYDKLGNITTLTNALGDSETMVRDAAGAVTSATMPGALTTTLVRDAIGKVTSFTTPTGNTWKLAYDALERPAKITDPLGNSTSFSYTGAQLTGATLPLGTVAIVSDADDRVTQRKFSDGTTINTAFDTNGALISADGVTITRDAAMRPASINGIAIGLDGDNRASTFTYAAGKVVTYAYDKSGRLASVTDWVNGKTTLAYDGAGRLTTLTYPNGIATAYTYDADGRVLSIAAGNLSFIVLTRDAAGKVSSANRNVPRATVLQAATQQFSYDAASQMTAATSDAMGRVTGQNGRKYTWNLASQLTSFTDALNSGTFTYDGLGEMSSSTATGAAQNFVFNYATKYPSLAILRQAAADLRYYVYLPNGLLLYSIEAADSTRHFYHFDEMGNTIMLTNDAGALTDSYAITPYGEIADHAGTSGNPFTWQGQYGVMQEGAGLYYLRNRHYDANAARFLSRDAITTGDPRSSEPYIYARGNPLRYIDPRGTLSTDDLQDAGDFIDAIVFSAFASGPGAKISFAGASRLLVNAIGDNSCAGACVAEGWELVNFIDDHNDLTAGALFALLVPPVKPPPPAPKPVVPPSPVLVVSHTPAPVQVVGPPRSLPTLPCLAGGNGLVSNASGTLVSNGSGTLISQGVGDNTLISQGTGDNTLISQGTGDNTLISQGTGDNTLISQGVGENTLVSNGSGTLIGNSGSTARPAQKH